MVIFDTLKACLIYAKGLFMFGIRAPGRKLSLLIIHFIPCTSFRWVIKCCRNLRTSVAQTCRRNTPMWTDKKTSRRFFIFLRRVAVNRLSHYCFSIALISPKVIVKEKIQIIGKRKKRRIFCNRMMCCVRFREIYRKKKFLRYPS